LPPAIDQGLAEVEQELQLHGKHDKHSDQNKDLKEYHKNYKLEGAEFVEEVPPTSSEAVFVA